jgi:PPOX class probable F420-dependent enzyme
MTPDETRAFLLEGTRTAALATVRSDGRPHVAPVWFTLDGEDLLFTTGENTIKGANLQRQGRVALMVDDEVPPFAFVSIEGDVSLSDDLDTMRHWATRIATRYIGEHQADTYGRRNAVPGELLVRVRPTKIVAVKDVADQAGLSAIGYQPLVIGCSRSYRLAV